MFVRTLLMGDRFIDVAVDMEVFRTVVMAVLVKMHAVAPQSPKNVAPRPTSITPTAVSSGRANCSGIA